MGKFGENIKFLRKKDKLSQQKFGEKYNVDGSNVSRWETGKAMPDSVVIKKIASDFGVSLDWLMGEKTDDDPNKLDLKEIKKALLEKELTYDGHELTPEEQESVRTILLAVIEREEKKANR